MNISSVHSGSSDYNLIIMLPFSDPIIESNHQVEVKAGKPGVSPGHKCRHSEDRITHLQNIYVTKELLIMSQLINNEAS